LIQLHKHSHIVQLETSVFCSVDFINSRHNFTEGTQRMCPHVQMMLSNLKEFMMTRSLMKLSFLDSVITDGLLRPFFFYFSAGGKKI